MNLQSWDGHSVETQTLYLPILRTKYIRDTAHPSKLSVYNQAFINFIPLSIYIQPPISLHPTTPPTKHATNLTNLTIVCACVHRLCLSTPRLSSLCLSSLCLSSLLLSFIVSGSFQSLAASIIYSCVYRLSSVRLSSLRLSSLHLLYISYITCRQRNFFAHCIGLVNVFFV